MSNDVIPVASFVAWGREGGRARTKRKARAVRKNLKLALKALKRRKVKRKQLTLRLRTD